MVTPAPRHAAAPAASRSTSPTRPRPASTGSPRCCTRPRASPTTPRPRPCSPRSWCASAARWPSPTAPRDARRTAGAARDVPVKVLNAGAVRWDQVVAAPRTGSPASRTSSSAPRPCPPTWWPPGSPATAPPVPRPAHRPPRRRASSRPAGRPTRSSPAADPRGTGQLPAAARRAHPRERPDVRPRQRAGDHPGHRERGRPDPHGSPDADRTPALRSGRRRRKARNA